MVTVKDYERYSMDLYQEMEEDKELETRQTSSRANGGDSDQENRKNEPPTSTKKKKKKKAQKKRAKAQKKRQEERLAQEQAWRAQQQWGHQAGAALLSAPEQAEYLGLLSRYQNRGVFTPTANERVEVLRLGELQLRVATQQREFAQRWPHVPGLRPERLTDGVASWSQAQLAKVLRGSPEGAWEVHERQQVVLMPSTPVQPGLLGHVLRKAGVLVRPTPGCKLLVLPSQPGVAEGQEEWEWRECPRPDGESLLVSHGADLLLELDTLLLDWHGRPWLLPLHITEGGRVCLESALPSGIHREANRRFCNWLLEQWVQVQQQEQQVRLEGQASGFSKGHHGGTQQQEEEKGANPQASFNAPPEDDPMEVANGPNEMDFLSVSSSPRSADLVIDDEASGTSPRGGGIITDDEEKAAEAKAQGKEDSAAQATTAQGGGGAWSVDLWELAPGGKRLLLQHQAWECGTNDGSMLCTMVAKPEYQSHLGAEQWSGLERAEQEARLLLFPALLKVRVDIPSNEVLLVEQVERQLGDDDRDRLNALFAPVAALLEQLAGLPPGPYLLVHGAGEVGARLLMPSQSGEDGGLDLHAELTSLFRPAVAVSKKSGKRVPPPLPLDPQVIFPHHFRYGRVPLTISLGQPPP